MAEYSTAEDREQAVIAALLSSGSIGAAAKVVGLSEKTVDRMLAERPFQLAYRAARSRLTQHAIGILARGTTQAVGTLIQLLKSKDQAVQCRAALGIVKLALGALETEDMAERLEAVEELLAQPPPPENNQ